MAFSGGGTVIPRTPALSHKGRGSDGVQRCQPMPLYIPRR